MTHGTRANYLRGRCRCEECTKAASKYIKDMRDLHKTRKVPATAKHGTRHCYIYYGCRCADCRWASALYRRRERAKRRMK